MNKLLAYLNRLDKAGQADFCNALGTSEGYVRKAVSSGTRFRAELCVLIERYSLGEVSRKDLRADWSTVWPEMRVVSIDLRRIPAAEWHSVSP